MTAPAKPSTAECEPKSTPITDVDLALLRRELESTPYNRRTFAGRTTLDIIARLDSIASDNARLRERFEQAYAVVEAVQRWERYGADNRLVEALNKWTAWEAARAKSEAEAAGEGR